MRSDNVTKGVQQAPHRSLMNALGMTEEEKNRPLIGGASGWRRTAFTADRQNVGQQTVVGCVYRI